LRTILVGISFIGITVVFGQQNNGIVSSENLSGISNQKLDISEDSTLIKYSKAINGLVPIPSPFDQNKPELDSIFNKRKLIPGVSGQLSAGYEYGLLTGYFDPESTDPLRVFNTHGDLAVEAFKLPVNVSYNYSTFLNPLGVNNYFRVSLDTDKLRQLATDKKNQAVGDLGKSIKDLENGKHQIQGKLGMGEVLMQKMKKDLANQEKKMKQMEQQLENQKNSVAPDFEKPDSAALTSEVGSRGTGKTDSLQQRYEQMRANYDKGMLIYDSINKLYNKALTLYNTYSDWQHQLEDKKSLVDGFRNTDPQAILNKKAQDKKESMLSGIKTFDLGLSYPQTSALSKNSAPIQGINIEMQRKNWYSALSAGVMMNNLMVSTDVIQNKLNNSANLFNQFDFQNVRERGFLTSVKSGYGTKEGTHFFVGLRYLSNAVQPILGLDDSTSTPSLGAEIDIRLAPQSMPNTKLDFVYGKTSLNNSFNEQDNRVINSLFSNQRTNTGLIKVTQYLPELRSEVSGSVRVIDPYADVRSFGAMQPDNIRYELRTIHKLMNGIRVGFNYRHDRNNIAHLSDTTISLNIVGGQLNGSIGKKIHYFGSLNYLLQQNERSLGINRSNNYMGGAGISGSYELFETEHAATLSYNDFLITDTISTGAFRNVSFQNLSKLSFGQNAFTVSYFSTKDQQIISYTTFVVGDEVSFQGKKMRLTGGIKVAFSEEYGNDMGAKLEFGYKIMESLEWTLRAEKLVLGDFYNYYSRERFDRFPCVVMTRVVF
jgi:hypothetical protein